MKGITGFSYMQTVLQILGFYESIFVLESVVRVDKHIDYLHLAPKAIKTWALRKEGFKRWKSSFMTVQRK